MKLWVALATFCFGVLAVLILYLLLRRVIRWVLAAIGGTTRSSFAGLCFAGLVAPEYATSLARGLIGLATDLVIHAPLAVYLPPVNPDWSGTPGEVGARYISQAFDAFPLWALIGPETFLFLLIWLGTSSLLEKPTEASPEPAASPRPPFGFLALLLTSLFLSVAALIAIPTLTDVEAQNGLTAEDLTKQIDALSPSEAELSQFGDLNVAPARFLRLQQDLEAEIEPVAAAAPSAAAAPVLDAGVPDAGVPASDAGVTASGAPAVAVPDPAASRATQNERLMGLMQRVKDAKSYRAQTVQLYNALVSDIRNGKIMDGKRAISKYQRQSLGRAGARETREHFDLLVNWYASLGRQRIWAANVCRLTVLMNDAALDEWARNAEQDDSLPPYPQGDACPRWDQATEPPDRPPLGEGLGIMGLVSRWLIKTESLTLAIIIGMLGFGMLGATLSTVVKEWKPGANWASVLRDGWAVFFRGLAAAFLVFVSVQGGGAVFTGANVTPNPYVLFFFCTLAGVFSETIWRWGEKQLAAKTNGTPPAGPTAPPPTGPPPAP